MNAKVRIVDFGEGDSTYVEYGGKILYDVTKVVYTKESGKSATLELCIDVGMSGPGFGQDGELDDICQAIKKGEKYIPRTASGDAANSLEAKNSSKSGKGIDFPSFRPDSTTGAGGGQ